MRACLCIIVLGVLCVDALARGGGHSHSSGPPSFGTFVAFLILIFVAPVLWAITKALVGIGFEKLTSAARRTLDRIVTPGRFGL
jgi:hypothetical protein